MRKLNAPVPLAPGRVTGSCAFCDYLKVAIDQPAVVVINRLGYESSEVGVDVRQNIGRRLLELSDWVCRPPAKVMIRRKRLFTIPARLPVIASQAG